MKKVCHEVNVHKFGGTSLADAKRFVAIKSILSGKNEVIVVSAVKGTTTALQTILDAAKNKLKYFIKEQLRHDNLGSFATRADRKGVLLRFADDLVQAGFRIPQLSSLKRKHITAVVDYWKQKGLSNGTLKNRVAALRHLTALLNKQDIIPSNQDLGIGKRRYIPASNRALFNPDFSKIHNEYLRASLELQRVFGLRREEALKIRPHAADHGDKLELQASWCKGGRARSVPIRTEEQRYWLEHAKKIGGDYHHSLIPTDKTYIQQRWTYDRHINVAGLHNLHGLRHAYAQLRYKELTGWEARINGGPHQNN